MNGLLTVRGWKTPPLDLRTGYVTWMSLHSSPIATLFSNLHPFLSAQEPPPTHPPPPLRLPPAYPINTPTLSTSRGRSENCFPYFLLGCLVMATFLAKTSASQCLASCTSAKHHLVIKERMGEKKNISYHFSITSNLVPSATYFTERETE